MLQGIGCDPHAYDEKLTGTNFGLRANYYPPMSEAQYRAAIDFLHSQARLAREEAV